MQYTYDFSYSLHLEHMPKGQPQDFFSQNKQFSLASKAFLTADCLKSKEIKVFVSLLLKQPIFAKIGTLLVQLSEIELELVAKNLDTIERLEALRQELCEHIKEMNVMLGRQREYYLNVIILIMTLILVRALRDKHDRDLERWVVFHLLHWELKGQHSTNAFYQKITMDLLIEAKVNDYIDGVVPGERHQMVNSLCFKQLQNSQSMKIRQSVTTFALALSKENQQNFNKTLPNTISLKKVGHPGATDAQVRQPQRKAASTFQNCFKGV